MRVLADTCVIVDVLQNREPFCKSAKALFLAVANNEIDGFISAKSVTDIYYLTHRLTHSIDSSREILKKLLSLFKVLDTSALDCRNALSSPVTDYEDAVMCETAERCGVDFIVTRNIKDYKNSKVKSLTPDELLTLINAE